jgi:serine/threonine protein phosphatase 1
MKKLFVVSDVHSFCSELKVHLAKAGFDAENENHWLIVCGDAFDRGDESEEMLHFLMSLERKILVRGNHDTLLEDCCKRGYAQGHDFSNGTAKTIYDIGNAGAGNDFSKCCELTLMKTQAYRDILVNYFETKNYIFVHGWIPCEEYEAENKPWWQNGKVYRYNPDWRNCNDVEWESAQWCNGVKQAMDGIIEPDKTIVCGHWHCSYGHYIDGECEDQYENAIWEPYYTKGCIAIDRCTAYTGEVNVLVLEDEFLDEVEDATE